MVTVSKELNGKWLLGDWSFKGTLMQTEKQLIFSSSNNEQYTEHFLILKIFELFTHEFFLFFFKKK